MQWLELEQSYQNGTLTLLELLTMVSGDLDLAPEVLASVADESLESFWESGVNRLALCATSESPQWLLCAGRAKMVLRRLKVMERRGFGQGDLLAAYQYQVQAGYYCPRLLAEHYSTKDFVLMSKVINPNLDLDYDFGGANLLNKRYLMPEENLQEALAIIAMWLASPEPRKNRLLTAIAFYQALAYREISLATPLLMNLRRPNGQLSSCFILGVEDSLKSISQAWVDTALISQHAGGVGIDLSLVRAVGATVAGAKGASGGVTPWVRIFNDIAVAVNQQGKRKGAVTVALGVWHLDIHEFVELRSEAGDLRRKAPDIFPQVVIPDCFMEAVERDGDWWLHDPHEVRQLLGEPLTYANLQSPLLLDALEAGKLKLSKVVKARDILKLIMRAQVETGLPYLFFIDTVNRANPNLGGYIPCANLCQESYSVVKANEYAHCCNLASLNLSVLRNIDRVEEVAALATRILDNAIDITNPPIPIAQEHNRRFRTIGVGAMGLADWLAVNDLSYGSEAAIEACDALFERIALACLEESVLLAKTRGTFADYNQSAFALPQPLVMGRPLAWYIEYGREYPRWGQLFADIAQHGIRNSQVMAIAPNSSTSLVHRCVPSVMPIYRRFYVNQGTNSTPVAPPYLETKRWFYKEYRHLCLQNVINQIATIQKWVDTGISFEWLLDLNQPHVDAKYLYDCILYAWRRSIKTIYYVRTVEKREEACESCAN